MVSVWERDQDSDALTALPKSLGITLLSGPLAPNSTILSISFREAPEIALSAGRTEVFVMALKDGKTIDDLLDVTDPVINVLDDLPAADKPALLADSQPEVGDPNKFIRTQGWESAAVRKLPV